MKKITMLLAGFSLLFMIACGGGETKTTEPAKKDVKVEEPAAVATPDFTAGEVIYTGKGMCATCHQAEGQGLAPAFPPLANADYLLADVKRAIKQTMYGAKTPITVNGQEYPGGIMTTVELTDQEVMDVVNYILNSWGNDAGFVTLEDVAAAR